MILWPSWLFAVIIMLSTYYGFCIFSSTKTWCNLYKDVPQFPLYRFVFLKWYRNLIPPGLLAFCHCDKNILGNQLLEKRFLAHCFRDFSPWSSLLGLWSAVRHGRLWQRKLLISWQIGNKRENMTGIPIYCSREYLQWPNILPWGLTF